MYRLPFSIALFLLLATLSAQSSADTTGYHQIAGFNQQLLKSMFAPTNQGIVAEQMAAEPWVAPWKEHELERGEEAVRHLLKTGELRYAYNSVAQSRQLYFTGTFPLGIDPGLEDYQISVERHRLKDGKDTPLQLETGLKLYTHADRSTFGADGTKRFQMTAFYPVDPAPRRGVTGAITFSVSYRAGIEHLELTAADLGRKDSIAGLGFELVSFGNNHLAFACTTPANNSLQIVQYDAAGNRLMDGTDAQFQLHQAQVDEAVYNFYANNPEASRADLLAFMLKTDFTPYPGRRRVAIIKIFPNTASVVVYRSRMSQPIEWTYKVQ